MCVKITHLKSGKSCGLFFVLLALALGEDGFLQPRSQFFRQFVERIVAVDLNRFLGRVQNDFAVVAPMKVLFQFHAHAGADGFVKIIGQLDQEFFALHGWPSPLRLDLKYFARRSRNCKRARNSLDFTAGMLNPSISAVSSVERPSTSRNTNTVLNPGGRP